MGETVGDILPIALGVAISPVPIIAVILMLLAPHAKAASVAFMVGWVVGITAVVTLVVLLAGDSATDGGEPSTFASIAKLVLGLLAILIGVKQWRGRPRGDTEPALPKWMAAVDTITAPKAGGLGLLLSGVNPKNLTLGLSGGILIAGADLDAADSAVCVAVFVVIGSCTVAAPVIAYLLARSKMQQPLDELRQWLTANNAVVMTVLMLVIGVVIAGKGLGGLL